MNAPPRLIVLDGMRGAAATMVLVHHASLLAGDGGVLPRGYLAVDFFFMLSGFVMARTYEPRLASSLGARAFLRARVRRLYPTMAAGIVLGAIVLAANGAALAPLLAVLAIELVFVPRLAGAQGIYRLDGVQWSLLFELFANLAHALVLHRLRTRTLVTIALLSLMVLAAAARAYDGIAVGDRDATFVWGVPRVSFSYVAGIVLARSRPPAGERAGTGAIMTVTLLVAVVTAAGLVPGSWPRWLVDLGVAALAFPALILSGARARATAGVAHLLSAAGAISFPLYAVHLPAISLALLLWGSALGAGPVLFARALAVTFALGAGVWLATIRTPPRPRFAPGRALVTG